MSAKAIEWDKITLWTAYGCALLAVISFATTDQRWIGFYLSGEEFKFESRVLNIDKCLPIDYDVRARDFKVVFLDGFPNWVEINGRRTYSCESTPNCSCGSEKHCDVKLNQVRESEICLSIAGEYSSAQRRSVAVVHGAEKEMRFRNRLLVNNLLAFALGSFAVLFAICSYSLSQAAEFRRDQSSER